MIRYFDASALVKRYVRESGSEAVRVLLAEGNPATSRLSEVEVASALVRRCHEGSISQNERDRALKALRKDCASLFIVELTGEVTSSALDLLIRYRLRAGDAVQLASCLQLRELAGAGVELVAYDDRLADAAEREGLVLAE